MNYGVFTTISIVVVLVIGTLVYMWREEKEEAERLNGELLVCTVKTIPALEKENDELKAKNQELEDKVDDLRREIRRLKEERE